MKEKTKQGPNYAQDLENGLNELKNYKLDKAKPFFDKIIAGISKTESNKALRAILVEGYTQKGHILRKGNAAEIEEALKCFKEAIALDSNAVSAQEGIDIISYEFGPIKS